LRLSSGIALRGAGSDSTFVTGPGSVNPPFDAVIEVNGDAITVERLYIRSSNSLGIGVWLRPGIQTKLLRNQISGNRIGVYTSGAAVPRTVLDGNRIIGDSIGIVTTDSSRPIIRNSYIFDCPKYGMEIRDLSQPDLGVNDTTGAGHDTIQQCGDNFYRWLIYNSSPDTIWAIGNTWQYQILSENDLIIYDDEESGVSGPVIIEQR
jgi:parallel beta-helix repeat protein